MKTITIILALLFTVISPAVAQRLMQIHGNVKNAETGQPVNGASVVTINGGNTSVTDKQGNFSISVRNGDSLAITHVGFIRQSVVIVNDTSLFIILSPDNVLLENLIINTGYQHLKPNEANGSYTVVTNKMLNLQTNTNILDRLTGLTNGLLYNTEKRNRNPQNKTNISIRGLSTINGPLDPLIVVDNFIYEGDIHNISPNDVESITILKDAAATSIWGSRAGNGVIVITLKKSKLNQPLQIDFSVDVISTDKPDLFQKPAISNADFIQFEQMLFNAGFYKNLFTSQLHPAVSPAVQIFQDRKNNLITRDDSIASIHTLIQIDSRGQYYDHFLRRGLTQNYGLNLRGGGNNIAWLLAGDYQNDIDNSRAQNQRTNLRFENEYTLTRRLRIATGLNFSTAKNVSGLDDFDRISIINGKTHIPYLALIDENYGAMAVPAFYNRNFLDTLGGGRLMNWEYFPLEDYKHSLTRTSLQDITAHVHTAYQLTNYISFNLAAQYEKQATASDFHADTASYYTRNLINSFSQLNRATGVVKYIIPQGGILQKSLSELRSYNLRGQVNFRKRWESHYANILAGLEMRSSSLAGNSSIFYGYQADPLLYAANIDYNSRYPNFITGRAATIPTGSNMSSTVNRFVSQFASALYAFKDRYTLSGSLRRDGSNIFGASTNDKWKPLWSAGLGWEVSKEEFYKFKKIPYLRIAVTQGVSGNVDLSKSALPIAHMATDFNTNLPIQQILTLNNPSLSWERSYQTNFRLEFTALNRRLTGSVEYYLKRGSNLYGPTPYDYTAGGLTSTIVANVANMKGSGIDVSLHSINLDTGVKWETLLLFNHNESRTTKYFTSAINPVSLLVGNSGNTIVPIVGKPLYAIAAYRWGGLDSLGNPLGYLNGTLSSDYYAIAQSAVNPKEGAESYKYIGRASPAIFGSLLNEISFKTFTLAFNVTYKFNYFLFKPSLSYSALANFGIATKDYNRRWMQRGDEQKTNVPSFVYPLNEMRDAFYHASEINVIKGDHVRLQFINLTYTFLNPWKLKRPGQLQVYMNVRNLGILWRANDDRIDPDFISAIPAPITYTIGLRTNF